MPKRAEKLKGLFGRRRWWFLELPPLRSSLFQKRDSCFARGFRTGTVVGMSAITGREDPAPTVGAVSSNSLRNFVARPSLRKRGSFLRAVFRRARYVVSRTPSATALLAPLSQKGAVFYARLKLSLFLKREYPKGVGVEKAAVFFYCSRARRTRHAVSLRVGDCVMFSCTPRPLTLPAGEG